MNKQIKAGLLANAASLGIHWIYNYKFLNELSLNESLLFRIQDPLLYRKAKPSYFSYPNQKLGDVSVQGDMLKWLYEALKNNNDYQVKQYENMLFKQFMPGGSYQGYVETYAKKQVIQTLSKQVNIKLDPIEKNDDHLVGFMPYLAVKALNLNTLKAWELTQLYTLDETYLSLFKMFDVLIDHLKTHSKKDALNIAIKHAPKAYVKILNEALIEENTNDFIDLYAGRACSIDQSIPVIFHVFAKYDSFEEAIKENAKIGGAIADRATVLGYLLSIIYEVPDTWYNKLK